MIFDLLSQAKVEIPFSSILNQYEVTDFDDSLVVAYSKALNSDDNHIHIWIDPYYEETANERCLVFADTNEKGFDYYYQAQEDISGY